MSNEPDPFPPEPPEPPTVAAPFVKVNDTQWVNAHRVVAIDAIVRGGCYVVLQADDMDNGSPLTYPSPHRADAIITALRQALYGDALERGEAEEHGRLNALNNQPD